MDIKQLLDIDGGEKTHYKLDGYEFQLLPILPSLGHIRPLRAMIQEYLDYRIVAAISNDQSCCEYWGYCLEDPLDYAEQNMDDLKYILESTKEELVERMRQKLVGCRLLSVKWGRDRSKDERGIAVVEIRASRGQSVNILLYNFHNGYYSHDILLLRGDITDHQTL